ncbi:unnamed protein product, partial [Medioppia subpectinata]
TAEGYRKRLTERRLTVFFALVVQLLSPNKEKSKKKSVSKIKKRNSSADKLLNTTASKGLLSTTTSKSNKLIRSQKAIKKSVLSSKQKLPKNKLSVKNAKQTTAPSIPTVNFSNGLSSEQKDKAVEIVTDIIQNTNQSTDLVDCIRKELERELGLRSNVILSSTPFMDQSLSKIPGSVAMQLGVNNMFNTNDMLVSVFGVMNGNEFIERSSNLMKRAQKLSPRIIDSLMSTDMKQEIQKLSTKVVRNAKSMAELSDQLSEVINDRYGTHWHTVVGHKDMMSVDNHRKSSIFYINMNFGDMRVSDLTPDSAHDISRHQIGSQSVRDMSRHIMPFFNRPERTNLWDGMGFDTSRIFESHFGSNLTDDDFFAPMAVTPSYYVRRRPFRFVALNQSLNTQIRQLSGGTSPGIRSVVPQSQELVQSDKFQVMVDVSHFTPEELTVKTVDNTIVVTAKHEDRADDFGFISRQFSRKYLLPVDIDPLTVTSSLSPEGILTLQAPRKQPELKEGERNVPISLSESSPIPQPKEIPVVNETAPK